MQPAVAEDVTAADLFAVTLLNVAVPPLAVRNLLDPGPIRDQVTAALRNSLPERKLACAKAADLQAADELYQAMKKALGGNRWVTASKLCARKRPHLIPVRDRKVVRLLRLPNKDFRQDLLVFRYLVRDEGLMSQLREAAKAASKADGADLAEMPDLRLLDTLLWMMR